MNYHAVASIYKFEMARALRTLFQSVISPVISTTLYFVVFGAAMGSRVTQIDGIARVRAYFVVQDITHGCRDFAWKARA